MTLEELKRRIEILFGGDEGETIGLDELERRFDILFADDDELKKVTKELEEDK